MDHRDPIQRSRTVLQTGTGDVAVSVPIQLTVRIGNPLPVENRGNSPGDTANGPPPDSIAGETSEHEFFGGQAPAYSLPELEQLFDASALQVDAFSWNTALATAVASKVVYFQPATIKSFAQHWGLTSCRFIEGHHTQCFVASTDQCILVCFRGTEPNLADWLGNLNVLPVKQSYGRIHSGFLNGFLAVRRQLEKQLEQMPKRPIILSGHSLGGALSVVAAAEWHNTYPVEAVYTYGQPAVGKRHFATFVDENFPRYFRIVNDDDVVPRVPPTYRHSGELFHFDAAGQLDSFSVGSASSDTEMLSEADFEKLQECCHFRLEDEHEPGAESMMGPILEGLLPSVSDHSMDRYIEKIDNVAGGTG